MRVLEFWKGAHLLITNKMLRFRNTLTGRVEEFRPMREGEVRFYYCGPTVWDYGHIGNFRSAVAADILRRYLKFKGFKVTHVMNITDVEDRIILKSQEAGLSIDDYTAKYIDALWEDFDALGCERPEIVPRATRHIPEMVSLIERLLETNHAYQSDGSVYYRIASFPEYGKLSKINFAGNIAGANASTRIVMTRKTRATLLCGNSLRRQLSPRGMHPSVAVDPDGTLNVRQCQ
jgi:cysteinyl-tRNA synthetase